MTRILSLAFVSLIACGKKPAPPQQNLTPAAYEARALFDNTCSTCHGADGRGDGSAGKDLNPKPRNYTDKAWQRSVTDDHIRDIILRGGAALGKSPKMPAQTQLADKPGVVNELVKIVRSFGA